MKISIITDFVIPHYFSNRTLRKRGVTLPDRISLQKFVSTAPTVLETFPSSVRSANYFRSFTRLPLPRHRPRELIPRAAPISLSIYFEHARSVRCASFIAVLFRRILTLVRENDRFEFIASLLSDNLSAFVLAIKWGFLHRCSEEIMSVVCG
jgi:hypothetical protein